MMCRMSVDDGAIVELRRGENPVVLRRSKRLLFEEDAGAGREWKTCDFDGGNVKLVADGLMNFGFPGPSETGDELLMLKYGGSDGPRPYIVNSATGKSKPVNVGPGLWAYPVWH